MEKITFNSWDFETVEKIRNSLQKNIWKFKCYYSTGELKWEEIIPNIVVDEGLNHALDILFLSGTQYADWYVALFNTDSTPANTWDYAGINTDQTEFTSYDETARPQWNPASIVGLSLTDDVTFTASTGVNTTLYGAYLVNVSTKGDSSSPAGIMWCATRFNTPRPYVATEVLNVTYAINSEDV